jgi:hypothetical protein
MRKVDHAKIAKQALYIFEVFPKDLHLAAAQSNAVIY